MAVDLSEMLDTSSDTMTKDPIFAHIIDRGDSTLPAHALVMAARVNGTPLTALCGHVWVPSRNPENHPLCPKCEEIYEFAKDFRGV